MLKHEPMKLVDRFRYFGRSYPTLETVLVVYSIYPCARCIVSDLQLIQSKLISYSRAPMGRKTEVDVCRQLEMP